jgi:hypothetical protein
MSTLTPPAGTPVPVDIPHLHRVRNGVRAVLTLGVAASVAGNVLHAQPTLVGRAIAAWSPLALLLAVELISRVPVNKLILSILRMISTAGIAGIAAWVSYGHMVSVAQKHGENSTSAHLLPLSVDGLIIVASVSLVEIAARLRQPATATTAVAPEAPAGEAAESAPQASVPVPEPGYQVHPDGSVAPVPAVDDVDDVDPVGDEIGVDPAPRPATRMDPLPAPARSRRTAGLPAGRPAGSSSTATVVQVLRRNHPDWKLAQIAEKAGCSIRTARRHLNTPPPATGPQVGSDDAAAA